MVIVLPVATNSALASLGCRTAPFKTEGTQMKTFLILNRTLSNSSKATPT